MWVFCCGMPRSGSTLQYQLTAHLIEDAGLGQRIGWIPPDTFPELIKKYKKQKEWKVLKSHKCTKEMAREFRANNAVGIYSFRDLRDVFVSRMQKWSKTFEEIWEDRLLRMCLSNYKRWTRLPRVLISKYEEMIADVPREVERIAGHLGIKVPPETCALIAAEYSMQRQKERMEKAKQEGRLRDHPVGGLFDPTSRLHERHINKGTIGAWKQKLSRQQVAQIEEKAGDWLVKHGYLLAGAVPTANASREDIFGGRS